MAGAVDQAVGSLAVGALGFVAILTFSVLSIVAYAKYTGTDAETNVNKYKENCGPGTLCSDVVRGAQKGGKRRSRSTRDLGSRKTRRRHK
jgi:hypothetical protein